MTDQPTPTEQKKNVAFHPLPSTSRLCLKSSQLNTFIQRRRRPPALFKLPASAAPLAFPIWPQKAPPFPLLPCILPSLPLAHVLPKCARKGHSVPFSPMPLAKTCLCAYGFPMTSERSEEEMHAYANPKGFGVPLRGGRNTERQKKETQHGNVPPLSKNDFQS